LLTLTSFQRHFLECLACFEYITIYKQRPLNDSGEPHPLNKGLIGAVTCHLEIANQLYYMGVPVWLVRPPGAIPYDMNIGAQCYPRDPS
ncbi:hypothetical protein BDZ97DRAFT_1588305, partial [Flammula alnicola]